VQREIEARQRRQELDEALSTIGALRDFHRTSPPCSHASADNLPSLGPLLEGQRLAVHVVKDGIVQSYFPEKRRKAEQFQQTRLVLLTTCVLISKVRSLLPLCFWTHPASLAAQSVPAEAQAMEVHEGEGL